MSNKAGNIQVKKGHWIAWSILLTVIVTLVFVRICGNEFVPWDDQDTLYANPRFNPRVTAANVLSYWRPSSVAGLWIPVSYSVWGALSAISRVNVPDQLGATLNPAVFHAASLLVHLGNVLLVFQIVRRLIGKDLPAAIGAALFAVHPVQVETVAWASGLKDLLAALFSLLAIWQYMIYVATRRRSSWVIGIISFVLAMLCKPTGVVTPLLAGIIDLLLLRQSWREMARSLWPWFMLMIPCLIWTKLFQPGAGIETVRWPYRPLVMTDALAFYFYKLVWPAQLCADYGRRPEVALEQGWLFYTWVIPVTIGLLLVRFRRRAPLLLTAGCVFVIALGPMLGWSRFLFQYYSTVADHYLYLAMLGPAMALGWIVCKAPSFGKVGVAILLAVLAGRSVAQEGYWSEGMTFFSHIIDVNPRSFMAYNNRGRLEEIRGDLASAAQDFRRALEIKPDHQRAMENLQRVLNAMQQRNHR